jgi:hypothetical protein
MCNFGWGTVGANATNLAQFLYCVSEFADSLRIGIFARHGRRPKRQIGRGLGPVGALQLDQFDAGSGDSLRRRFLAVHAVQIML